MSVRAVNRIDKGGCQVFTQHQRLLSKRLFRQFPVGTKIRAAGNRLLVEGVDLNLERPLFLRLTTSRRNGGVQ